MAPRAAHKVRVCEGRRVRAAALRVARACVWRCVRALRLAPSVLAAVPALVACTRAAPSDWTRVTATRRSALASPGCESSLLPAFTEKELLLVRELLLSRLSTADHACVPPTRRMASLRDACASSRRLDECRHQTKNPSLLMPHRPSPSTRRCSSSCSTLRARRRRCERRWDRWRHLTTFVARLAACHELLLLLARPRQRHPLRRAAHVDELLGLRGGLWRECVRCAAPLRVPRSRPHRADASSSVLTRLCPPVTVSQSQPIQSLPGGCDSNVYLLFHAYLTGSLPGATGSTSARGAAPAASASRVR